MSEDASLDEFLDSGGTAESTDEDDAGESADGSESGAEATGTESQAPADEPDDAGNVTVAGDDAGDVTPATTTYAWSDEGTTCEACGADAERRWEQDGRLVCPDCKEW